MILVISGPSSVGKTKVIRALLALNERYSYVVSYTSRLRRMDENEGRDYFFISKEEFKRKIINRDFLQWKKNHSEYYGTGLENLEDVLLNERIAILDVDPDSFAKIKVIRDKVIGVFLLPASVDLIKERLENRGISRGIVSHTDVKNRFEHSVFLSRFSAFYDYILTNNEIQKTAEQIDCITKVEKLRMQKNEISRQWFENELQSTAETEFNIAIRSVQEE